MSDIGKINDRLETVIPGVEEILRLIKQTPLEMEEPAVSKALATLKRFEQKAIAEAIAEKATKGIERPMRVSKRLSLRTRKPGA